MQLITTFYDAGQLQFLIYKTTKLQSKKQNIIFGSGDLIDL